MALTSTLTVFETFTPGRPMPPGLDVLLPQLKEQFVQNARAHSQQPAVDLHQAVSEGDGARARVRRRPAGTLIAGTDPTGGGGVIPGYSNQRQIELLVEAGFTPLEAISDRHARTARSTSAATHASARSPSASRPISSSSNGDPSTTIADIRNVETVFKQGVGFDPAKLIESVKGKAGLW